VSVDRLCRDFPLGPTEQRRIRRFACAPVAVALPAESGSRSEWFACNRRHSPASLGCEAPGASPSGYQEHEARAASLRCSVIAYPLRVHSRAVRSESRSEYGWPRVWKERFTRGIQLGKERACKQTRAGRSGQKRVPKGVKGCALLFPQFCRSTKRSEQ
jgi:hypothetical protein